MGRKRGRTGRTAKREERDQGYPANADRVVRRAVRRLVKVERRLERARRELDESAADIETLHAQIRALRVAMMAPGVEAAPEAAAGEPVIAEAAEEFAIRVKVTIAEEVAAAEEPGVGEAEEPAEGVAIAEEVATAEEEAEEPADQPLVAEEPATVEEVAAAEEPVLPEEPAEEPTVAEEVPAAAEIAVGDGAATFEESVELARWADTGAPGVSPEAGEALEASWPSAITGVLEPGIPGPDLETPADAGAVAQAEMEAKIEAEIEAEIEAAAVAEIETAETPGEALLAEPDLGPAAVLAGDVLEPGEAPQAGETVLAAAEVPPTPAPSFPGPDVPSNMDVWPSPTPGLVPEDSRWPLPEDEPATLPDAAAEPGAPSAADAAAAAETDADAAVTDLADQAAPQRRIFRGWPFIDPERRW